MKAKNYFQAIFFLFLSSTLFGQITLEIDEISLNGQTTIKDCNTVDFGTVSSNNLVFYYTLSKPLQQAVSGGTIKVKLKYDSSSSGIEKKSQIVPSSNWNNAEQYSHTISANINASEIQVSGSSVLLEFIESGITRKSCEYPLTKTPLPSFTLTPSSISLACPDRNVRIFTVTPANIPSGATVTYSWSHSGWLEIDSTPTTKTLQPISGTNLPSSVSVTPSIDGVVQQTKTSNVSRAPFATSASIDGNNSICSTGTYTVIDIPSGVSIESVSSSNASVATASLGTNNEITVTKVSNGTITLSVTLENACSQTETKTKSIQVGENATVDISGLENGIDAGGTADINLSGSNGCGTITFTDASAGITFDYVGPDYAALSASSSSSGTGWIYVSISGGTSIYKEFPINVVPPPVLPDENLISITRLTNDYPVYPYSQWKMVKVYYYGNSSDVDYWEWDVNNSYYAKPNDDSVIFLPSSSSNVNVSVRACNSNGCSQYVSTVIN